MTPGPQSMYPTLLPLPVETVANLTRVPVGQGQGSTWGLARAHPGTGSPQDGRWGK